MKKRIMTVLLLSGAMMTVPARADEAELLARIEALEQLVAQLEQMIGIEKTSAEEITEASTPKGDDPVELKIGTWIVGEDIAAGKYSLTASSDTVVFCSIYKDLDTKLDRTGILDFYTVTTDKFLDEYAESLGNTDDDQAWRDMYTTIIHNVYLQDGQCIEVDNGSAAFIPAQ